MSYNQKIYELNEKIVRLEANNNELKQLVLILEQMSVDLMPVIMKCKCVYNSLKIKSKLNDLKEKYNYLKQNNNSNDNKFTKIVDKIKNCSKTVSKIVTKKGNELEDNSATDENNLDLSEEPITTAPKRVPQRSRLQRVRPPTIPVQKNTIPDINFKTRKTKEKTEKTKTFLNKQIIRKYDKIRDNKEILVSNREKTNKKRNEKNVLCNDCGKQFRDTYELKFHEWRHSGQKLFACDWPGCNKQFSSRYLLKHQKSHSDPKLFVCNFDDCNKSVESNEELNKHFKESHDGHKPFKCYNDECHQEFASKTNLLQHKNWNHSSKQFICEWPGCESSFKRKHLLRDHMNSKHIGYAKYRCEWPGCEFNSGHSKSFSRHKLIHTGEKPFKCEFEGCEWRFRQSHQLKQHYLVHTGESPVCCQFDGCDQRFKTRRVMLSHFKRIHAFNT